jgi:drug/metabolite transporter (DMT)-like permease
VSAAATALVLIALSAALHAVWNALVKRQGSSDPMFVWLYSVLALPALLALLGWWALQHDGLGENWWAALVSTVLHTSYALVLQRAYKAADMSAVYPVSRGVAPVLVSLAVVGLQHTAPSAGLWLSLPVILAGALIATDLRRGVRWGLFVATFTAAYTLWDSCAARELAVEVVPYLALTNLSQVLIFTAVLLPRRREMPATVRSSWRAAVPITVLVPSSFALVFIAMRFAPPEMIAASRNLNVVFGVLVGVLLLGERPTRRAWLGIGIIAAGAALAST